MNKNHIQLLNEYCVKVGLNPSLHVKTVNLHPPFFEATYTFNFRGTLYVSTGSGQRKKDAQLEAARAMFVDQLKIETQEPEAYSSLRNEPENQNQNAVATTARNLAISQFPAPAKDGNPAEELGILCTRKNLEAPEYFDEPRQGPPHCPVFTVRCKVGELELSGRYNTKKMAKRAAAYLVLMELKRRFAPEDVLEDKPLSELDSDSEETQRAKRLLTEKSTAFVRRLEDKTYDDFFGGNIFKLNSELSTNLPKHEGTYVKELLAFSKEVTRNREQNFQAKNPQIMFGKWLRNHQKGPKGFFEELQKEMNFRVVEDIRCKNPAEKPAYMLTLVAVLPSDIYQETEPTAIKMGDDKESLLELAMIDIITYIGMQSIKTPKFYKP